jgi:hypothetical protein
MIKIYNKATNEFLGRISEDELQFLVDHLEEESLDDHDYYLRRETIRKFVIEGATPRLIEVLEGGMGSMDTIEIRWEAD